MTMPYTKEDAALQAGLAALQEHVSAMIRAGQTAYRIRDDIRSGYIAESSALFQLKLDSWIENYNLVMRKFDALGESTASVDNILNQAEDDAGMHGANWDTDAQINDVLSGR